MPKQPPRNGYYYFMLDFRARMEREGRRFHGGMAEVSTAASADWNRLTQAERDDYNDYAKENRGNEERRNVPKRPGKKFNSMGESLSAVERRAREKKEKDEAIAKFVEDFVKSKDIDWFKSNPMYLIHVNIFCQTDDGTCYPAELAICEFNLKQGPTNTFHTFFDPGEIKKGYGFTVKEHSEKTHRITLPYVQKNSRFRDYERIFDDICRFLKFNTNQCVPLFTMYDDIYHNTNLTAVEKTLETLWENKHSARREDEAWRRYFPVYPLPLLFFHLKNRCYAQQGETVVPFPNSSLALAELNRDIYNFRDEFGCKFHQEEDAVPFCSQSYVMRWARIIADHSTILFEDEPAAETETELNYSTPTSGSVWGKNEEEDDDDDDDRFTDCRSIVSGISSVSAMTNMTERSIQFGVTERSAGNKEERPSSSTSVSSSVWVGGRGRGLRPAAAPSVDDDNFPALSGIGRGMRGMKLNR